MEKEKSGWQALSQEVAEIHAELDGGCTNVEIQHLKESCAVLDRKLSAAQKKYDRIKRDLDEIRRRRDGSLLTDQATNSYLQCESFFFCPLFIAPRLIPGESLPPSFTASTLRPSANREP